MVFQIKVDEAAELQLQAMEMEQGTTKAYWTSQPRGAMRERWSS